MDNEQKAELILNVVFSITGFACLTYAFGFVAAMGFWALALFVRK